MYIAQAENIHQIYQMPPGAFCYC